jgi:hypothetical protein
MGVKDTAGLAFAVLCIVFMVLTMLAGGWIIPKLL